VASCGSRGWKDKSTRRTSSQGGYRFLECRARETVDDVPAVYEQRRSHGRIATQLSWNRIAIRARCLSFGHTRPMQPASFQRLIITRDVHCEAMTPTLFVNGWKRHQLFPRATSRNPITPLARCAASRFVLPAARATRATHSLLEDWDRRSEPTHARLKVRAGVCFCHMPPRRSSCAGEVASLHTGSSAPNSRCTSFILAGFQRYRHSKPRRSRFASAGMCAWSNV